MPRPLARLALSTAALLCLAAPVHAQSNDEDPNARVATVNGKVITRARIDALLRERAQQGMPDSRESREAMKDDAISREVLAQEAERRGLLKAPDTREQMEIARQVVLIRALLAEHAKANQINDDAVKAEYERLKATMPGAEYKARHILVETENEAKDLIAKLKKGGRFDDLAKASLDPGSKDRGGDLGWSVASTYVPPFAEALGRLKKGETTEAPVRTQFGFHVIRLDDTRSVAHPPLDQVRPQITQRLQSQSIDKLVADLRAKAKVQ